MLLALLACSLKYQRPEPDAVSNTHAVVALAAPVSTVVAWAQAAGPVAKLAQLASGGARPTDCRAVVRAAGMGHLRQADECGPEDATCGQRGMDAGRVGWSHQPHAAAAAADLQVDGAASHGVGGARRQHQAPLLAPGAVQHGPFVDHILGRATGLCREVACTTIMCTAGGGAAFGGVVRGSGGGGGGGGSHHSRGVWGAPFPAFTSILALLPAGGADVVAG